ncbi:hypothetical protein L0P88_07050 [Muricauda sp. SCSIO 64092]|uniref:hypothetical protein n=1 Tax=Allomuricauda sp. SCSIO 64092 TaxID=2908842 RepID=UPI001FF417B8|nr:hypothetical protein [Muricauda sp. SCSIO 64092]UOY08304.1 hypothetical protein L0P88_07050 [Muricauda sp. SCSIO 64092]
MSNEIQINCFTQLIEDTYGSSEKLANHLDKGIEMLFYVEKDTFERKEIQDVVAALREIVVVLRKTDQLL